MLEELNDLPVDAKLNKDQAKRLEDICRKLRETMYGEAKEIFCFHPIARLFSSKNLLDNIEEIIGTDVYFKLTDKSRKDLCEAGKCLAFGMSTATAFHLMRAVEETMRQFFQVIEPNRPLPGRGMMGEIENYFRFGPNYQHRNRRNANYWQNLQLSKEFINDLGVIRSEYRNPTQHPEKFYSQREAEDLLGRVGSIPLFN